MRVLAALVVVALPGCAAFTCTPATIVVAETQRQDRLETRVESYRIDPILGRVQEIRHNVIEPAYWVRAAGGDWIAVDEATWRQAEKGKSLEVCR